MGSTYIKSLSEIVHMKISCTAKARLLWKEYKGLTSKIYHTSLKTNYFFSQTEESLLALSIMDKLYGFDFCSDTPKCLIIKSRG